MTYEEVEKNLRERVKVVSKKPTKEEYGAKMRADGWEVGYLVPAGPDTYRYKDDLKRAGGEWTGTAWLLPGRSGNDTVARRAALGSEKKVWINWRTRTTAPLWADL